MPAFVINGPDIPEILLEAHEEGRIVFFCGAGISYPADLPGFKDLVNRIYDELSTERTPTEERAYEIEQFDTTLDLLERRYPGQRVAVRAALSSVLDISNVGDESTITHGALLELATDRRGKVRLVTTNFDRLFHHVITKKNLNISSYSAPLLPIPKKSQWDGIVYLHGLLPDSSDETELDRLVFTSGDFGLAYLTERWAARFVTELFRNYTICFVGYTINDPVLRYMMDALAADELRGEKRPDTFAFASYRNGKMEDAKIEWEAKGVIPLLYEVFDGPGAHSGLHLSIKEWANTYKDGVQGKEMIISQHASTPPLAPSKTDYAVGRVLWALSDGLAAEHFANLNPVPPLEWLEPLSSKQFKYEDLSRFGVTANNNRDDNLLFSILHRPASYAHSPSMCIVDSGTQNCRLDPVMFNLARWLMRHLGDPKLIVWLASHGGSLHENFTWLIHNQLNKLDSLAESETHEEIDLILDGAPNAIPGTQMRTLWRLFMAGMIRSNTADSSLTRCLECINRDGLTASVRIQLRENLSPRLSLRAPYHIGEIVGVSSELSMKDLVNWDIVLASDHVHHLMGDWSKMTCNQEILSALLQDFTLLLRDTMDLSREIEDTDDGIDLSYINRPSISDHSQNDTHYDWTVLIDLTRDAWLATVENNPSMAKNTAEGWWQQSYTVFKRLALFAATYDDVISQKQALGWLLEDNCWCLWSLEMRRESMRLLVSLATRLEASEVAELEAAILAEPPKEDIEGDDWRSIVDRMVWLLLAKYQDAGGEWGESGNAKLDALNQDHPNWKLAEDERDEFPFWMGNGDEWHTFTPTPLKLPELVNWLKEHETSDHWKEDDWRQRCHDDFAITSHALRVLAEENTWPDRRWKQALMAWSEEKDNNVSWNAMAPVLNGAPTEIIHSLGNELSWWLQIMAKSLDEQDDIFLNLCRRILELDFPEDADSNDLVSTAINRPVGIVTEALLQWCYRRGLEDNQGIPEELKLIFIDICNVEISKYRYGRVLLAAHVATLHQLDSIWTTKHLLPLFEWSCPSEACAAFKGFLWSPRLYRPLLAAIKQPLLEAVMHYQELDRHANQLANLLTYISLDPGDVFAIEELTDATKHLPIEGLESAAKTLTRAIDGAENKREEYWKNRILPYLDKVWPKDVVIMTSTIPLSFARLCVLAEEAFPNAFDELKHWIVPQKHPYDLFSLMSEKKVCTSFPEDSLSFLSLIVGDETRWFPKEFQGCLDEIKNANPQLGNDHRFIRLSNLSKRYAIRY